MSEQKNLWNMGLDEVLNTWQANYLRVPGGWLVDDGRGHPSVFIPYSEEFKPKPVEQQKEPFKIEGMRASQYAAMMTQSPNYWEFSGSFCCSGSRSAFKGQHWSNFKA